MERYQKQPIIIFVVGKKGEKSDHYVKDLANLFSRLKVAFRVINDVEGSLTARSKKKGVIRVTNDFSMGFDLKMGENAFVLVVCRDW